MFSDLTFDNPIAMIINVLVILILLADVVAGYKKGFLEHTIKFVRIVLSMIGAYLLKGPLSAYMYINLPFFNLDGLFDGVTSINILIYELIAFFVVFVIILIIVTVISDILKLEERLLRIVSIIGVPNKIMGAIIGLFKSLILLYFGLSLFFVGANFMKWDPGVSLGNYIVEFPVLKNTFGLILDSFDEITKLAVEYEDIQDKEELNKKSIDILLKYDIITEENLELLIESGKIQYSVNDSDSQKETVNDLYETVIGQK